MSDSDMSASEIKHLIEDATRKLAYWRNEGVKAESELDALQQQLEESERWQTHNAILAEAKDHIRELDAGLRKLGVEYYEKTGSKTAHQFVKVRVVTRLAYDRAVARAWAQENLLEAFEFNPRIFEKYAKSVHSVKPLPFVTFKEEPESTISPKISHIIGEQEEDSAF